jgi:hypothetical protein
VKFAGPRIDGLSWDQHGLELVSTLTPWELVRGTPLFKATKDGVYSRHTHPRSC